MGIMPPNTSGQMPMARPRISSDEEQLEIAMLQRGEGVAPRYAPHNDATGLSRNLLRHAGNLRWLLR